MNNLFVVNMTIHAISFNGPSGQPSSETIGAITETLHEFDDKFVETCDDVSERRFINIVWRISGKRDVMKSTITFKGSQQCDAGNVAWFISGRIPAPMVMECDVTEEHNNDLHSCKLLCQCPCGDKCGFLHFRWQNPLWMKKNLSLCHYEEYYYLPW